MNLQSANENLNLDVLLVMLQVGDLTGEEINIKIPTHHSVRILNS